MSGAPLPPLGKPLIKEPIQIVAHSQGTMITLAALSDGMKFDGGVFLHSDLNKSAGPAEKLRLQKAFGNVTRHMYYVFDRADQAVTLAAPLLSNNSLMARSHESRGLGCRNGTSRSWSSCRPTCSPRSRDHRRHRPTSGPGPPDRCPDRRHTTSRRSAGLRSRTRRSARDRCGSVSRI